jgi:hypothetical protein
VWHRAGRYPHCGAATPRCDGPPPPPRRTEAAGMGPRRPPQPHHVVG